MLKKYWFDKAFSAKARSNKETLLGQESVGDYEMFAENAEKKKVEETKQFVNFLSILRERADEILQSRDNMIENEVNELIFNKE